MPNLDDDMDELFRRAADNYPLKMPAADWEGVKNALSSPPAAPATRKANKNLLALFLLLFVFLGTGLLLFLNQSSENKKTGIQNGLPEPASIQAGKKSAMDTANIVTATMDNKPSPPQQKSNNTTFSNLSKTSMTVFGGQIDAGETIISQNTEPQSQSAKKYDEQKKEPVIVNETFNTETAITNRIITIPQATDADEEELKIEQEIQVDNPDSSGTTTSANTRQPAKFYYGASIGISFSHVKNQGSSPPSVNAGVIVGLQISKQFSVEAGVGFTQKKYYSEGEYFHPKTGSMPANMTVKSLQGQSNFIEIPVTLKYNFTSNPNGFFAAAGISSYIIVKENNQYDAMVSGQPQQMVATYKNSTFYPASGINIMAGYQHSLGKKTSIRIEPYIQIPLTGVGVGALPVTSTGVHLILTRN